MLASCLHASVVALAVGSCAAARSLTTKDEGSSCKGSKTYRIKFDMNWSRESHPVEYPSKAMFSPFFTVAHNDKFSLWREGEVASDAIKDIAELGDGEMFNKVVKACYDQGNCGMPMETTCKGDGGVCVGSARIEVSGNHPYVSTASMHAPSPDWFTGVDSWNLCEDGKWVESISMPVNAYDAGTDSGLTFMSEDAPSDMRDPITSFGAIEPAHLSIFYNPEQHRIPPVGMISIYDREAIDAAKCKDACKYEITFDMQWNGANHPIEYPADGFFAPFWTVAHDKSYTLWREGEMASDALKQIAETGAGDLFMEDARDCNDAGSCGEPMGIECEPQSGTCKVTARVTLAPEYPYLSVASMHAPSPDWFTGVDSWQLCKGGEWVREAEMDVNAYDAGTDAGLTFMSQDFASASRDKITSFAAVQPKFLSIFYNPEKNDILPVGNIKVSGCMKE